MTRPDPDPLAVDRLLDRLVDLSAQERRAALDAEDLDANVRHKVEELLRRFDAVEMGESLVSAPAPGLVDAKFAGVHPERIDHFTILGVLGSGGMGVVYLAEQQNPTRKVAIKVLRADFTSEDLERRFQVESEALGRLSHPGIATIHEVGTADLGRGAQRYFAMEYVEGRSITDYVRTSESDDRAVLELVARVCDAIHHAHQKGVIHRDLKPANILVDGSGAPRILDFGIARVADLESEDSLLLTRTGQLVGTLAYISPEQVSGRVREIDTRTDVYALGVLTYELLTGELPLDVANKPLSEVVRTVLETEPAPLTKLRSDLASDVDWIVAKAMEKEPQRRYASAHAMALDIRRWIADEPVNARPPTTFYRVAKFARRNRGWVVAGASIAGALVATTAISIFQALRVSAAYDERGRALEDSDETVLFFAEMLTTANPYKSAGNPSVREVLQRSAVEIPDRFSERPRVEARLSHSIGLSYSGLGLPAEAEPLLRRAHEVWSSELGEDDPTTLAALGHLAVELVNLGRWDEARTSFEDIVRRGSESLGPEDPIVLAARAKKIARLEGSVARDPELMRRDCLDLLPVLERVLGPDHENANVVRVILGQAYFNEGRHDEAAGLFEQVLGARERRYGSDNPIVADTTRNLIHSYVALERLDEALDQSSRALDIYAATVGLSHPNALASQGVHVEILTAMGRVDEAAEAAASALAHHVEELGETHQLTWQMMITASEASAAAGRSSEAAELAGRAVSAARAAFPDNHLGRAYSASVYGAQLHAAGRHDEAIEQAQSALDFLDRHGGPDGLINDTRELLREARAARQP